MPPRVQQLGDLSGSLLVFGGPYSNLQATQAIKRVADTLGIPPERTVCTGDIVAYCADPAATLDLVRDWGIHVVKGNCEESLAAGALDCGCGFEQGTVCSALAVDWYRYASEQVSAEQRAWLRQLPSRIDLTWEGRSMAVIHGGLEVINRFIFPSASNDQIVREMELAPVDLVVGGHSGIPFGRQLDDRAWLNAGAIGLPANDGTRDGWYLLLEPTTSGSQASWHRLVYDAEQAAAAMRNRGLSGGYGNTLLTGLWPSLDVLPEQERREQGVPLSLPAMTGHGKGRI
ncbi:MAG: metallophosphoesterase family protein [Candidatus Krumholzibacteria bacterium]|nr:metallophosphoesterase family protein [Candidatus Krumholzibacteria bacterium]